MPSPAEGAEGTPSGKVAAPAIYATRGLVKIYDKPDREAPVVGAFRAGQSLLLKDASRIAGSKHRWLRGCTEGWHAVEPRGFVCVGGPGHASRDNKGIDYLAARAVLPALDADYPFKYGVSTGTPQYLRIPSAEEQGVEEPDLAQHLAQLPPPDADKGGSVDVRKAGRSPSDAIKAYLALAKPQLRLPKLAYEGYKISWSQEFDAQGRTWLVTPDLRLIPKDRIRQQALPSLKGIDLKAPGAPSLPLAFFWLSDTEKRTMGDNGALYRAPGKWARHSFVGGTMNQVMAPGGIYWQLRDDGWVNYRDVTMIRKAERRPPGVGPQDKWVDVRVTWGFLVAYEGDTPVYATAMSPGADGVNPRAHATARGRHRVDWKMFSGDMSGRDKGRDWYVDEVPWVQYYKGSYAVHGAWWHNDFGRPKSHGCVNLAPADARHLFGWMDPQIPRGWYAVSSRYPDVRGTLVSVRH